MCGIAGFLDVRAVETAQRLSAVVEEMAGTLRHRGPDAGGAWVDAAGGVALGHRRLSILDLSQAGAQPMHSASGRYVISYNGEIYNFGQLQEELRGLGQPFRGHSDTEVLLSAIERWGVEKALDRTRGMFAWALWDREERALTLARDPVGKKPLYYGWSHGVFLFGSELRALRAHPAFDPAIDRDALGAFLQHGWIPHPLTIHRGIRKLPPGSFLRVDGRSDPVQASPRSFWSARLLAEQAAGNPSALPYEAALDAVEGGLEAAVAERMVADVEVGALLSGGIDSSTVVALMQRRATRPVKTFTIGFAESKRDESMHAAAVARHLGTEHRMLRVTPEQARELIPALPRIYDEPFADVSQVPTVLVSRLAAGDVKVVLSGDGGDELFAGYTHYLESLERWRRLARLPVGLRAAAERWLERASRAGWRLARPRTVHTGATRLPAWRRFGASAERVRHGLSATGPVELLARRFARCGDPAALVVGARPALAPVDDPRAWAEVPDPLLAMRHFDFIGFLTDDILVKVDRASMAFGLEVRCPILDVRLVALAWSLPPSFLLDRQGGKRILRDLLHRFVPGEIVDRPKKGFGAPIGEWLRGPLREWAEDLIAPARLRSDGFLEPTAVRELWDQHLCGWRNRENLLWAILMFQAWRAEHP